MVPAEGCGGRASKTKTSQSTTQKRSAASKPQATPAPANVTKAVANAAKQVAKTATEVTKNTVPAAKPTPKPKPVVKSAKTTPIKPSPSRSGVKKPQNSSLKQYMEQPGCGELSNTAARKHGDSDVPFYGEPGGYSQSPDGTKERVYGPDGKPSRDRHHTNHGNPKNHPDVPHDHDWGFNKDGKWDTGPAYPSPSGPLKPQESQSSNNSYGDEIFTAVGIGIGGVVLYELAKWGIATLLAPSTMGGSMVIAGVTP